MNTMNKKKKIEKMVSNLKRIANKSVNCNINISISAITACSKILYHSNQLYSDNDLESLITYISDKLKINKDYIGNYKTVLFYDGFGLDLRGWAASFVKAINSSGYNLIYVTSKQAKGKIPNIERENHKGKTVFIEDNNYHNQIEQLNEVFSNYRPSKAFFYTTPYDVIGNVVFQRYKDHVKSYLIDLTDHAFWLGKKSTNYVLESRSLGASIAIHKRDISPDRIIKIDCAPYVRDSSSTDGLPFDINTTKYVYSGGQIYKTLGDEDDLYYKMVRSILLCNDSICFLYSGNGDKTKFDIIKKDFPDRLFVINEREDFFTLMKNCVFFLNTYPVFGGLMMRYAALAKKIPLTLKYKSEADDVLLNQNDLGIEYASYDSIVEEIDKLINNDDYRMSKEEHIIGAVISEEVFLRNIKSLLETDKTDFKFSDEDIKSVDTSNFQKLYLERFDCDKMFLDAIVSKKNMWLIPYYPFLFIKKIIEKGVFY